MLRTLRFSLMSALLACVIPLEGAVLTLNPPAYSACGEVSINGGVLPSAGDSILQLSWSWGDSSSNNSFFIASHRYSKNGTYSILATATSQAGESISQTLSVTITSTDDPICAFSVRVHPTVVALRDGRTSATLWVEIRDTQGNLVPSSTKNISFVSSNPAVVSVDSTGQISAGGFGMARITVRVEGFPQAPISDVYAGRLRVLPPVLYLSPATHPKGRFELNAANADGTALDLSRHQVRTQLIGPADVAKMDADGTITALRAPLGLRELVSFTASIDGVYSSDNAALRINDPPFDPDLAYWPQPDVVYFAPKQTGHLDNVSLLALFQVPETTQAGYLIERFATGVIPWQGDIQYLANIAGPENPNQTYATIPCGASGNAIGLGTDINKSQDSSCLWNDRPPVVPQWFVIFHELGHNFTLGSKRFSTFAFASPVQNSVTTYVEGLASLVPMYLSARIQEVPSGASGISPQRVKEITSQVRFSATNTLNGYVARGSNYAMIDPTVLDDILAVLMNDFGSSWVYRFYSVFLPQNEAAFPFTISNDVQQATFFVAAVSAATGVDLRSRFTSWGFPRDDAFWAQIYPDVAKLVSQRDPVAFAGSNRQGRVGEIVKLNEADAFSFEGSPSVTWRLISKPQGSTTQLSDFSTLRPSFTPDTAGLYALSLTASNGVISGPPATVTIQAAPPLIPTVTLVANAFGDTALIAPNTWVEIKGSNLAQAGHSRIWLDADFVNGKLPTQLDGVSVTVNGRDAYVYFISSTQVNILTPPEPMLGPVQVQLTNSGTKSNVMIVAAQARSLSLFELVAPSGLQYVYGRHGGDSSLIGPTSLYPGLTTPVKPGEAISLAGTGFGPTNVPIVAGALTQSGTLPPPLPAIKIGGIPATVSFAGLIAIGTYQFNIVVPFDVPDGDNAITVVYNGLSAQPGVLITVQR